MTLPGYKTRRPGVHPRDSRRLLAIRQLPFAPQLVVPLNQHLGAPAIPLVEEGQSVARGQTIAAPDGFLSVAMHSPASGVVEKIAAAPSFSGRMVRSLYIHPFPGATQELLRGDPCVLETSTSDEIIRAIQAAGIVGKGDAAIPTHAKLKIPEGHLVDTLLINGVECEPNLSTDHRVIFEQRDDIFVGLRYLLKATGATRAIIGMEANKRDAIKHLRSDLPPDLPATVEGLRVKDTQGAERTPSTALPERKGPSGGLPSGGHALCIDVATCAEIGRLLPKGRGMQQQVITVSGPAVEKKGHYRIPIGTPLRFVLETVGVTDDVQSVFLGGPMMLAAAPDLDIPITKGISGVTAFSRHEAAKAYASERACKRCGYGVDACPSFLNPVDLELLANNSDNQRMADERHLLDCFECDSGSYGHPSINLEAQQFQVAKEAARKMKRPHDHTGPHTRNPRLTAFVRQH